MSFLDTTINPDGTSGPPPLSQADFADKASWTAAVRARQAFSPVQQSSVAYSNEDLMSGTAAMRTRAFADTQGGKEFAALSDFGVKAGYWKPTKDNLWQDVAPIANVALAAVGGAYASGAFAGAGAATTDVGTSAGDVAITESGAVDTAAASDAGTLYAPAAAAPGAAPSGLAFDWTGLGTVLKGAADYGRTALGLYSTGKGLFGKTSAPLPGATLSPADTGQNNFFGGGSGSNQTVYLLGGIAVAVLLAVALARR